jgi:hypothetical protein
VLYLVVVTAVAAVVIAGLLYGPALLRRSRPWAVRFGLVEPPPPVLPPRVDRLARDLLRIRSDLETLDPRTPVARRRGVLAAYDDALADACRAMGLDDLLHDVPDGLEREVARLEVEEQLVAAGLIPARTPGR